jgi:hypothetical protein
VASIIVIFVNDFPVVAHYDMVANGSDSHASHFTPWSFHGIQAEHGLLWTLRYASDSDKKTCSGLKHMFRYAIPPQFGDMKHSLLRKQAI